MRAEWGPWKPPFAAFLPVLIGEHLRHAGPVGTTQVEGDMDSVARDVLWVSAVEASAIGMYHLTAAWQPYGLLAWGARLCHKTTSGQPRGLFIGGHGRESVLDVCGQGRDCVRAAGSVVGWQGAGVSPRLQWPGDPGTVLAGRRSQLLPSIRGGTSMAGAHHARRETATGRAWQ